MFSLSNEYHYSSEGGLLHLLSLFCSLIDGSTVWKVTFLVSTLNSQ